MEAQLTRPQEHYYDQQQPQQVGQLISEGDQDDQHLEKKSVLKKVKAKAKKLKDTLKLHAHGHNHDQEYVPDDHDLDEEDDDDGEETFGQQDQQIGGVSRQPAASEAAAVTSSVPGHVGHVDPQQGSRVAMQEENTSGYIRGTALPVQDVGIGQPELDFGRSIPIKEAPGTPLNTPAAGIDSTEVADKSSLSLRDTSAPIMAIAREQETSGGQPEKVLERSVAMEEHPYTVKLADQSRDVVDPIKPSLGSQEVNRGELEKVLEGTTAMEEVPHLIRLADQSRDDVDLTKPSFCEHETNRGQVEKVLEGPTAMEQDHPYGLKLADQSSDNVDLTKPILREQEMNRGQLGKVLEGPMAMEEDPHAPKDYEPSNYESKVTDPTGAGGKEADISPMFQSCGQLEIKDEQKPRDKETYPEELCDTRESMLPTGGHDQFSPELTPSVPISMHESADNTPITSETPKTPTEVNEQHSTEKPSNQSSYTDKVATPTSTIAEKAVAAKNVVASKLGYGQKEQKQEEDNKRPASPGGYSKTITSTVAEKLTPVYEKVAGAGSVVMSKVQGKGSSNKAASNTVKAQAEKQEAEDTTKTTESPRGNSKTITAAVTEKLSPVYETVKEKGTTVLSKVQGIGTSNEGVSVTSYIAEKLKPGEEDKALSEVIKERLYKPKEEAAEKPPIESVTESEEVKRYLGGGIDESGAGADANTKGVVGKLKGAVGSWFVKNEETMKGSQQSLGSTTGTKGFSTSVGTGEKGGLQESGN